MRLPVMCAVLLGLVLGGVAVATPLEALELRAAQELEARYGLGIAVKRHQRVVVCADGRHATNVLAVVRVPFAQAVPVVHRLVGNRYGEAEWTEGTQLDASYWEKRHGRRSPDPEKEKLLGELHRSRVSVDRYREITFRSAEYNLLTLWGWRRGHSRLTMRVLDGVDVFSRPSTIVWLQRQDEIHAWGWTAHMLVPAFHLQGADLVGEEEWTLIHELARETGATLVGYAERNVSGALLDSAADLVGAAKWLRTR